jgi:hypothetical protein
LIDQLGNRQNSRSEPTDRSSDKAGKIVASGGISLKRCHEVTMNAECISKMHLRKTSGKIITKSLASDPETMLL